VTLTTRLSLFFIGTLAVVLVAFSIALYFLAHRHLTQQLDTQLESAARTLASGAEVEADGVEWEPHNHPHAVAADAFGDELRWTLATDEGRVVDSSRQVGTRELLAEADNGFHTGHRNPRRFDHGGRAWEAMRLRLAPEPAPTGPTRHGKYPALVLTVAVPLDPIHSTLRTLAVALVGLTVVILVVALVASRAVCRRALAPVTRMAETARLIDAADLSGRLPDMRAADELGELTRAFNDLLDRLTAAFERERRFASEASHQLRTPLAGLIGQIEVALRREREPSEYRRVLDSVLNQAGRLRRVVESLLFLARSEADAVLPGLERTDLVKWIPSRLTAWTENTRFGDLVFEPLSDEATAAIQPDLFGELLDALIDNALKYSQPGTRVTVRVGGAPDGVWVEVEDRGCGIAAEDVPRLFRPFFRSESARKRGVPGVGLGLAVVARIAVALGGSVGVDSEVGVGSRVRVLLPQPPVSSLVSPAPEVRTVA